MVRKGRGLNNKTNKLLIWACGEKSLIKVFAIAFILLSIWVWFTIMTKSAYNSLLYNYGDDAAQAYSQIIEYPSQIVIFTFFYFILRTISTNSVTIVSIIVSWLNILLYIFDPNSIFKWLKHKENYGN